MAQLPHQDKISQNSKHSIKEQVLEVQFGDGFSQRTIVGQNQQADKWSVNYNILDLAERDTLLAFYRTHGKHDTFEWTAFGDSFEKKWLFTGDYSELNTGGKLYKITVNITQSFDI